MEKKSFKYDAFISYRHTDLDSYVAENLIKKLETYKLPKSVAKTYKKEKTRINRVFRDKEELPLTNNLEESIVDALANSEWLLVICSPRLSESKWCKKEIETFISLRGRDHVLAVLIEGSSKESFPEALVFKTVEVESPDGTIELVKEPTEPLAADFRGKDGKDKKGIAKAMKTEIYRILAAMFGVEYDSLRQRHKERKMRRIVTVSLLVGLGCLLFGVYSTVTALRIREQKQQIEVQSEQILKQSQDIQSKADEIQKQNEELSLRHALALAEKATVYYEAGNSEMAVKTALEALTESDGIEMPYTPEAEYILASSTRAYDVGKDYKASYQYEMPGRIEYMDVSPDGSTVMLIDSTLCLTLFDLAKREEIATVIKRDDSYVYAGEQAFLAGGRLAYLDSENRLAVYDIAEKKVIRILEDEPVSSIYADEEGLYLLVDNSKVYAGDTLQYLGNIPKPEDIGLFSSSYVFSEGIIAKLYVKYNEDIDERTIGFWEIESGQWISFYGIGNNRALQDIQIRNGVAYVLTYDYSNIFLGNNTYVTAISFESGEVLWETVIQDANPYKIYLPTMPDGTELVCTIRDDAVMMDMQTGEISCTLSLKSGVAAKYSSNGNNNWYFILENGRFVSLAPNMNMVYDMSDKLQCKSSNIVYAFPTPVYGVVIKEYMDNKITVYTTELGPGVKEITEGVTLPENDKTLRDAEAFEMAGVYGLERPEYISHMFHSEDGKYCFVYYWNGDMTVYDTQQKKVLNVIGNAIKTYWCLGTDKEGYTYLLANTGCYVLNRDMELIAWIENVKKVDVNKRMVYMANAGKYFKAPIYTLEELIEIAKSKQ